MFPYFSARGTSRLSACMLVMASFGVCGCGESVPPGPPLIPVQGTVKIDGQPSERVVVTFHPIKNTPGNGALGSTDAEGKFALATTFGDKGCPAGEYAVTFSKITQPDGSPVPPNSQQGDVQMVQQIPEGYAVFKAHYVVQPATVKAPDTQVDFELDSKFKPPRAFYQEQ